MADEKEVKPAKPAAKEKEAPRPVEKSELEKAKALHLLHKRDPKALGLVDGSMVTEVAEKPDRKLSDGQKERISVLYKKLIG